MKNLERFSQFVSSTFAIWVLIFAAFAFLSPNTFSCMGGYITILLGIVMFGMGLTITVNDFKQVLTRPKDVAIGVIGQFVIMPTLAYLLAKGFNLPPEVAVGVILVGCCPGGTSSNVMTFLSKGDVALSVTITSITTILAPFVTPALILLFASEWIDIAPSSLFISIVQVVLIPIILGIIVQKIFKKTSTSKRESVTVGFSNCNRSNCIGSCCREPSKNRRNRITNFCCCYFAQHTWLFRRLPIWKII